MEQELLAIILAAAPSISAIGGIIAAVVKIISIIKNHYSQMKKELEKIRIDKSEEYKQLEEYNKRVLRENCELKKEIRELVAKIDKVVR